MQAQMLSYSRAKGVFGGVSLSGTSLGPDDGDNETLYGKKVSGEEIFSGSVPAPPSATALIAELEKTSPKKDCEIRKSSKLAALLRCMKPTKTPMTNDSENLWQEWCVCQALGWSN
jgi:hypothetical protein